MSSPAQERIPVVTAQFCIHQEAIGEKYGVPQEVVPEVAEALVRSVEEQAFDPSKVVFSGHSGFSKKTPEELDAYKLEQAQRPYLKTLADYAAYMAKHDEMGQIDDDKRHEYNQEIMEIRRAMPTTPEYFFSGVAHLLEDEGTDINPIHFAGTGKRAGIRVYDAEALDKVGQCIGVPEDVLAVRAFTRQIRSAEKLYFRPQYLPLKRK